MGSIMDATVPVISGPADVYYSDDLHREIPRFEKLVLKFSEVYPDKELQFVARSPGRVNIIGEHIDHQLYEVLPMAIATDILIAVSTNSSDGTKQAHFTVANLNDTKFKPSFFSLSEKGEVDIDTSKLEWSNYFKAGLRGAIGLLQKRDPKFRPCGMDVLVDGSVPPGAGVSSSAAFVCASALAVLRANGEKSVKKSDLTELAIVSERACGVNSGGMDQAASVFPVQGDAVSVSFYPKLHAETISFPKTDPPLTFMIAQSFITANKYETAPIHYNLRVVECTLASEWLAAKHGVKLANDAGASGKSLLGFQVAYYKGPGDSSQDSRQQLQEILKMVESELTKTEGYTREEIASVLDVTVAELEEQYMTKFPIRAERFLLRQRAQHVFAEALRVQKFKDLLLHPPSEGLLPSLGALMNETQTSCRELYQNSRPELDLMCDIAREAGSFGSRVTGAGWGGCIVNLVPKDKVEDIYDAWEQKYYLKRDPSLNRQKLDELGAVVVSEPGHGAMV